MSQADPPGPLTGHTKTAPRGRFAPSPTGPLHMGSLVAALASYLEIKQLSGQWCVRIDDLDPPRQDPTAARKIIECLEAHGMSSDEPIDYQSTHDTRYEKALDRLRDRIFYCTCSRRQLSGFQVYPGTCRAFTEPRADAAIRVRVDETVVEWQDQLLGPQSNALHIETGDFVIKRRDGLWAYYLATAVDDACDFTHIVRGADLFETTAPQIYLARTLNLAEPQYLHVPVLTHPNGDKLSKQTHAPVVDNSRASENLYYVLDILGQRPPTDENWSAEAWIDWGIRNWQRDNIPGRLPPWRD